MRKLIANIFILSALIIGLNACRTALIYNTKNVSISPRSTATDNDISEAIWSAGRRLGWRIEKVGSNELRGVYKKNIHKAIVAIHFDKSHFNILYLESENLKFDGSEIHVNYNVWIQNLEKKIQNEINFRLP